MAHPRGAMGLSVFCDSGISLSYSLFILFLNLSTTNELVSSKIYDKQDDFNAEIVNFPFFDGYVSPLPMVCIFRSLFVLRNRNLFLTA